jgi:hypothetical protein
MYQTLIAENIAATLRPYYQDLEQNYQWKTNIQSLPKILAETPNLEGSESDKVIQLRKYISQHWEKFSNRKELYTWIIHEWGGIRAFRSFEVVPRFLQELADEAITYQSVSRISSLSKIAAFYKPNEYAIYDARVSLMVNWLLRMQKGFKGPFFKDLGRRSRNTKWLPKIRWEEKGDKPEYTFWHWDNSVFYFQYCGLLRFLAQAIDAQNPDAFQRVEMTLFSLPNTEFVDKIVAFKAGQSV